MTEKRMLKSVKVPESKGLRGLYALLAIVGVQLFLVIGSALGESLLGGMIALLPGEWLQTLLFTIDPILLSLVVFLVPSTLVCLWVGFVEKRPVSGLGFFKKRAIFELLKGFFIGVLLIGTVVGLQVLSGSIELTRLDFSVANLMSLILILPFWFIQSGTEELITRGWLFPVVSRNSNLLVGTAVSSLLFAVLHLANPSVSWISLLNIALFGLLACLYVLKTDNIWGIAAIHTAWNYFQGSFFGLNVSGISTSYATMSFQIGAVPDYLSGGNFGPEGSLIASAVLLAFILYLSWSLFGKKESSTYSIENKN
ncbi:CPBP family intramembrane glutamic endopeptidase [Streptococcus ovis]|uniref:CPBP family intramembrane glutamic endopeptidase n=1 Tax=Streptococcus ovis TaxID=82806 RepID=UPI0003758570|nr:type II CAAX endopeptidase family protein [Streptococcus ovis]